MDKLSIYKDGVFDYLYTQAYFYYKDDFRERLEFHYNYMMDSFEKNGLNPSYTLDEYCHLLNNIMDLATILYKNYTTNYLDVDRVCSMLHYSGYKPKLKTDEIPAYKQIQNGADFILNCNTLDLFNIEEYIRNWINDKRS